VPQREDPGNVVTLRDYQREAITATHDAWVRGVNRAAIVLPTGAGKTVVFAHPDFRTASDGTPFPGRMLILVHRDELALQAMAKLRAIDPTVSVGRVQNVHNEVDRQVIVGSVQTLARAPRRERIRDVGMIVVDEAHHATARTYREILGHFGAWRGVPTAGFSATLARSEDDAHLGDIWQEVVLRRDVLDGIRQGWLVDVTGKRVAIEGLDLGGVKRSHGDYSEHDLGEHLESADAPEHVSVSYAEHAGDRQGITFWPTVALAHAGADAYEDAGITTRVITGETSSDDRAKMYEEYRRGDVQMLSSVMVLTEGFDMPQASCAVIARPTRSAPLYVQMAGRVLRPHRLPVPGYGIKRDALLLDVTGASEEHKLATLADLSVTTKINARDDESLLDLADEQMAEEERSAAVMAGEIDPATGRRIVKDVDLFGDRSSVWLQTPRGTWFVPAGDWIVFLWPDDSAPGLWKVGGIGAKASVGSARVLDDALTLDWAMQRAEERARQAVSVQDKGRIDARNARWRSSPASAKQLTYAQRLGCTVNPLMSKGAVGDAISIALAARRLGG
jgi:superfamily II DNA or RNA helicase